MGGGIAMVRIVSLPCGPSSVPSHDRLTAKFQLFRRSQNFLNVGWPVTLFEVNPTALDRGIQTIRKNYENTAKKGRLTSADVEKRMSLLRGSTDFSSLADCDLIVEAIYENMEVKKDVFRKLGAVAKKDAILGTNTSALDIDEIASVLPEERRQYVVGHQWVFAGPLNKVGVTNIPSVAVNSYFSPANVMKMIEVVQARSTSLPVLAASMAISRHIGKTAVVAGVCYGFIGNRILFQRQREANRLVVEDGLMPWVVDRVLLQFGFPMGPFQMGDLAGLDVGWDPKKSAGRTIGERLCEMDRRGQKTGKGWYDYTDTRQAVPSKEVEEVIRKFRAEKGYGASKERSENEILERLLVPMINEAAEILEQGKAFRASDIDVSPADGAHLEQEGSNPLSVLQVMYVNGYGFPSAKGGLLVSSLRLFPATVNQPSASFFPVLCRPHRPPPHLDQTPRPRSGTRCDFQTLWIARTNGPRRNQVLGLAGERKDQPE